MPSMQDEKSHKSTLGFKISILALGSIATMCTGLVAPILPKIAKEYTHVPYYQILVKFIITMPHLVVLFATPFLGPVADRFNRKYLLCAAVIVYGTAGAACALINNLYLLVFMRAILGLCMATSLVVTLTLIADCLAGEERSYVIGLQTTFFSIATSAMSILGGIIGDINWHYNFLLYLLPTAMVPFGWKYLYEPRQNKEYIKYRKESDLHAAATGHTGDHNWWAICSIYVLAFVNMAFYYMIPLQIPFLLDELHMNSKQISLVLTTETLACAFFSSRYKKWKKNRSFITVCTFAFAIMAIAYIIIGTSSQYALIMLAMILYGFGMGTMMPNNSLWLTYSVGRENRGMILGGLHTAVYSGKFLSAIVLYPFIRYTSLRLSFVCASFTMIGLAISVLYGSDKINSDTSDSPLDNEDNVAINGTNSNLD